MIMSLVNVKCPNCGAAIQLDSSREEGFCSYCGSKVLVQEAINKVKIDKSGDIQNFLNLSKASIEANNGQEAYDYANKALEVDAQNAEAWYLKMRAVGLTSILKDLKCDEVLTAGRKAIEFDNSSEMKEKVYSFYLLKCFSDLSFVIKHLLDVDSIKKLYEANLRVNVAEATTNTLAADTICDVILQQKQQILNLRLAVPNSVITNNPQLASRTADIANYWVEFQNAINTRFKAYGTNMSDEALLEYRKDLVRIKQGLPQEELDQTSSEDAMDNEPEPTNWLAVIGGLIVIGLIIWWILAPVLRH